MGQPPLVSVIIPAYNATDWIAETVSSALAQTYTPLEVLVIDDASTDATWQTLCSLPSRPALRILKNSVNLGLSRTRNRAIQESRGEFIALLDHDDLWHPEKIAQQMALFKNRPNLGLVYSDANLETLGGQHWRYFQASPPYRGKVFVPLMRENFIPCLTAVIPRKVLDQLGHFKNDLSILEDYELFLRIAQQFDVDFIDAPLATYRIHGRNFTNRRDIYHRERLEVQGMYCDQVPLHGEMTLQRFGLGAALIRKREIRAGSASLAKGFWGALTHTPQFARAAYQTWTRKRRV